MKTELSARDKRIRADEKKRQDEKTRKYRKAKKRKTGTHTGKAERVRHLLTIAIVVTAIICLAIGFMLGRMSKVSAAEAVSSDLMEESAGAEEADGEEAAGEDADGEEAAGEDASGDEAAAADDAEASETLSLDALESELVSFLGNCRGTWSLYLKDLGTGEMISLNNQSMYAASLIKLFVMENSFQEMDSLISNISQSRGISETESYEMILRTMTEMITVSDNEAYNQMVRLWSADNDFTEGCLLLNESIQAEDYIDTGIYHTLSPSDSEYESTGEGENHTCAEDCGSLLEEIYNGTCVSQEDSAKMLELLLDQEVTDKIPAGVPEGVKVANKTGETEASQHDAAIVYGEKTDYILCIMSTDIQEEPDVYGKFTEISSMVYEYLNA